MYIDLTSCSSLIGFVTHANNDQLTVSSHYSTGFSSHRSRLYTTEILNRGFSGGWTAGSESVNEYIQIEFRTMRRVERVATQGRDVNNQRVTSYRIAYSTDGSIFEFVQNTLGNDVIFNGNTDESTVVQHDFDPALVARYVRLHAQTWNYRISLRWEVYGCDIGKIVFRITELGNKRILINF